MLLQAVAIVVFGGSQTVPITAQYLANDALASEAAGHQVLALATRHLADVPLSWVAAKALVIFAIVYLIAATVWRSKYEAWLDRGVNKLRWVGLGAGGGALAVTGAVLSGVSDIVYLALIFGAVFVAAMAGLAAELLGPDRRMRRLLVGSGLVAGILPWGVVIASLVGVCLYDGTLPTYLYYVYGSTFLLTVAVCMAGVFRLEQRGKWADTIYAERMFMILGFLAATVLAWQIFAGAL
jgi:hypothetical protein